MEMDMETKNTMVIEYITNVRSELEKMGISVSDEAVAQVENQYLNSPKSFEEIKAEMDKIVADLLEEYRKRQEMLEKMKREKPESITDLDVKTKGITLNMQLIDLLNIVTATQDNLKQVVESLHNLTKEQKRLILSSDKGIEEIKRDLFKMYQDSLISYEETHMSQDGLGKQRELKKRIEFVLQNCDLSPEQQEKLIEIINNTPLYEIPRLITETFDEATSNRIFQTLSSFMPTEKEGIKSTTYEEIERLAEHLKEYQTINIDEIAKYGHYARQDGKYNREDLIKVLDFAKSHGMNIRLNTLLFYMDTPKQLESMPKEQGKALAKRLLEGYVHDITATIAKYNAECVQRGEKPVGVTIEILNELLNRFAMDGEVAYEYRGHIDTDEHRVTEDDPDYDDKRAGWLRFLEVEDLCAIMEIARRNLPDANLMLNECTLEDPKKIEPYKRLILDKIRAYEQEHGIKLIDSLGTQMHVDTSITKEQMRSMFESMAQFGLPIEVTEFDMFTDREFVESHSKEEVEALKKKKIAEFCEVITEMKDKANIEGVSIWSVSDKHNFIINIMNEKIHKQNLERQKQGLEPIPFVKNVYGGYYDSEMKDITKSKTKGFNQEFNYHTHTYRSGHSTYTSDEEMVAAAKEAGITMLGFSEHIPNPDLILPDENHRMLLSEVDGYLASIRKMREENPDMTILAGFEAEYNPMLDGHLCDMRDKVDYMILGQHFLQDGLQKVQQKNNPEYPIIYAKMVVKAMQSGIFDIVAHPDIFMEYRDTIETAEGREQFDRNAEIASRMICETARDMGIPVEINLSRAMQGKIMSDGNLAYPHPTFWKVASETEGLKVIKGIDAHNPRVFKDIGKAEELVANIERMVSDKMIKGPYNPVEARENNPKLKAAYETTKANAQTVETHLVNQIVNGTLAKMDDSLSGESIGIAIGTALTGTIQSCVDQASKKDNATLDEITKVADSPDLSPQDKKGKLERKKLVAGETNAILSNQQRVLERAKANVVEAMNMGCSTKQEYSSVISQMTEAQSTKNGAKKQKISEQLTSFKQTKSAEKTLSPDKAQAKALIRDPNKKTGNGSNGNKSGGFANNTALALITSFGLGLLTGVSYMIFRILN